MRTPVGPPAHGIAGSLIVTALATLISAAQPVTVSVMVSVTNRSGAERVSGLTAADFRVVEDGVEQQVASVTQGRGPISVAVVLDTSDRMAGRRMEMAQRSVESLVAGLAPEDEVALVTYERGVSVAVPCLPGSDLVSCTSVLKKETSPVRDTRARNKI